MEVVRKKMWWEMRWHLVKEELFSKRQRQSYTQYKHALWMYCRSLGVKSLQLMSVPECAIVFWQMCLPAGNMLIPVGCLGIQNVVDVHFGLLKWLVMYHRSLMTELFTGTIKERLLEADAAI